LYFKLPKLRAWVDLDKREIAIPAGVVKNDDPLTLPLTPELVGMLGKLFRTEGPLFDTRISAASGLPPVLKWDSQRNGRGLVRI
jgi:hypothetical protein